MRKHLALLVFLVSFLASSALGQSRFYGTWEMKMDTLQFAGPPETYLIDKGVYRCLSCVPPVEVKADGTDQKAAGHEAFYDTIAVRVQDDHNVTFAFKKNGKPVATTVETVSPDGQAMEEKFTNTIEATPVVGTASFTRVSAGPAGAHVLSGEWRMDTVRNSTTAGTLTTFEGTSEGIKISDGSESCVAKLDGNDYPVGKSGHATIAIKLIDENTLEETDKRDGKVITVARMTVSRDGKSMKVESSDKQRGGTMTYTAQKRS